MNPFIQSRTLRVAAATACFLSPDVKQRLEAEGATPSGSII